jgi:hypothetical protein
MEFLLQCTAEREEGGGGEREEVATTDLALNCLWNFPRDGVWVVESTSVVEPVPRLCCEEAEARVSSKDSAKERLDFSVSLKPSCPGVTAASISEPTDSWN